MPNDNWLALAKRIQAIAQAGLFYTESDYDRDRYQELSDLSVDILANLSEEPIEKIKKLFTEERDGYQTPKVDIRAVVFNEEDEILMVQEREDGKWALPGGWADVGFTPKEVAVKEVREETGLSVQAVRVLAICDKRCHGHPPQGWYVYKIFILCEPVGGALLSATTETTGVKFFPRDNMPPLSLDRNVPSQIELVYQRRSETGCDIYCD